MDRLGACLSSPKAPPGPRKTITRAPPPATTDRIETDAVSDTTVVLIGRDDARLHAAGFDHYFDPLPGMEIVDLDLADDGLREALTRIDMASSVVWIVQYADIGPIDVPSGFTAAATERFDSRFFSGGYVIALTRLERVP